MRQVRHGKFLYSFRSDRHLKSGHAPEKFLLFFCSVTPYLFQRHFYLDFLFCMIQLLKKILLLIGGHILHRGGKEPQCPVVAVQHLIGSSQSFRVLEEALWQHLLLSHSEEVTVDRFSERINRFCPFRQCPSRGEHDSQAFLFHRDCCINPEQEFRIGEGSSSCILHRLKVVKEKRHFPVKLFKQQLQQP